MNIFFIPSWYITRKKPLSGIFFREQIDLLLREKPDLNAYVSSTNYLSISPRSLIKGIKSISEHFGDRSFNGVFDCRPDLNIITSQDSIFRTSRKFLDGNMRAAIKKAARDFEDAEMKLGKIDAIIAFSVDPAGVIGRALRESKNVPLIIVEHMGPFPIPSWLDASGKIAESLVHAWQEADVVAAVSQCLAEEVSPYCGGKPVYVLHNPLSKIFEDVSRSIVNSGPRAKSEKTILTVSRLLKSKGIGELIEAFSFINDSEYVLKIIGYGPDQKVFEAMAKTRHVGERVKFLGPKSRQEVREKMEEAEFLVMPSHSETFSVVCIEAIACGTPVIATECGGPNDIVTARVGMLVPPMDSYQLKVAMDKMAREAGKFDPSVLAADALQRFSASVFTSNLYRIIGQVLENRTDDASKPKN